MGRLDVSVLRYLDRSRFRFLTAVEMGMKNHEVVPLALVAAIGQHKDAVAVSRALAKDGLVCHEVIKKKNYEGVRLTNKGYDYLALKALTARGVIASFGNQIGTGKESNVYVVGDAEERTLCLKLHRLGRTCFRKVREKRDYHKRRRQMSWIYLSRISATKEFAYMKALYDRGFPVPKPIDFNRHCVVMELVRGHPLQNVAEVGSPEDLYDKLMNLVLKFANHGVIHGDFNEFNIMVTDDGDPVIIDFPQMVSTGHKDAREYFERDVNCIRDFFRRRFGYESELHPSFDDVVRVDALDAEVCASGMSKQMEKDLLRELGIEGSDDEDEENSDEDDDDEEGGNEEEKAAHNSGDEDASEEEVEDLESLRKEFEKAVDLAPKNEEGSKGESRVEAPTSEDKSLEKEDDEDDMPELPHFDNRAYKPFRDDVSGASKFSDSRSMLSTGSTIIDPDDVKKRVKASLARKQKSQEKRRISKKGVATIVNRKRRDNAEDIKTSTSAFWGE